MVCLSVSKQRWAWYVLILLLINIVKEYSTKAYYILCFMIKSMFIRLYSTTIIIFRRPIENPLLGGRDSFAHSLCMCELGRGSSPLTETSLVEVVASLVWICNSTWKNALQFFFFLSYPLIIRSQARYKSLSMIRSKRRDVNLFFNY